MQLDKLRRELDDDMEAASALCVVLKPSEIYIYKMCIIIVRDKGLLYIRQLDKLRREFDDDMETASALCVVLTEGIQLFIVNIFNSSS